MSDAFGSRCRRTVAIVMVAAAAFVVGCGEDSGSGGGGDAVTLDYLHWGPLAGPEGQASLEFAKEVESRTGGAVKIRVRAPGELPYKSDQALTAVGQNGVQMAGAYSGFVAGTSKMAALPQLPFLINSTDDLAKVFPTYQPFLEEELKTRFDAELLFWYPVPVLNAFGKGDPVTRLTDLEGRKIRATSPDQVEMLTRLGANPSNLLPDELAPALQTGVVDGFLASALFTVANKLNEQIEWAYTPGINAGPVYVAISSEAMGEIPAEAQTELKAVAGEFQERMLADSKKLDAEARATIKSAGVEVTTGTEADLEQGIELMRSYWDSFADDGGAEVQEALTAVRDELGK